MAAHELDLKTPLCVARAPSIERVGVMFNPDTSPQSKFFVRSVEAAAPSLHMQSIVVPVRITADIEPAFESFARTPNGGLILTSDAFTAMRQKLIVVIADGKTETKGMGTPHFEPHGWVPQWANDGDAPLVLLQANISEEGVPAVVMVQPPSSGPTR